MKNGVFWDVTPCGSCKNRRFGGNNTNLYLNAKSHNLPSNKQAVSSTLVHRARALCDEDTLQAELVFLKDVFKENGYNDRQIRRALNRRPHLPQPDSKLYSPSCPVSVLY
jgi:hypothetical protein